MPPGQNQEGKKRAPYKDRDVLYMQAREMRGEGYGYTTIAKAMGMSWSTIRKASSK